MQQVLRKESHKRDPMEKRSLDSLIKGLKCIRGKTSRNQLVLLKNKDEEEEDYHPSSHHHNAIQNRSGLFIAKRSHENRFRLFS